MSTAAIDRETLMKRLRSSGLLTDEQFQRAYDLAAQTDQGVLLAQMMVREKLLTAFQARMLVSGRTTGFMLGQYRILEPIGQGGMGRVFKAEHVGMGRMVAVKVLSSQLVNTPKARDLFRHEVKAAARLSHPNIVTAYDSNEVGDKYFLVMEYIDGPNVQELVEEQGPLPVGTACDFVRQAALALQYAYEHGMVHRDIKPANLLVQRNGSLGIGCQIKVLDFGLARLHAPRPGENNQSITADSQTVMGTPDYLSPEQGRSLHTVDIRSDLYSLGCTFYFMLTGRPPFPGGRALEKLVRHFSEEPRPITELRPDIPEGVAEIVHRLLAKNPLERHQSPIQLAMELTPFSMQAPDFLMPSPFETSDSDENINLGGTWSGYDTAVVAGGSSSMLFRYPAPPQPAPSRWDWIQVAMLTAALGLGFVLGAAALAVALLWRSRG
jgi:serine/threonine-protein kinase